MQIYKPNFNDRLVWDNELGDWNRIIMKDDQLKDVSTEFYHISSEVHTMQKLVHHVNINNEISSPHIYSALLSLLRNCGQEDEIHIYINSPGGVLATTIEIVNAIAICEGTVITHATGRLASAATLLFLAGHAQVIMEDISFMCHYYSTGYWGKGQEVEARAEHSKQSNRKFMWRFYEGFLTKDEFKSLCEGKDYWFGTKETGKRLSKRIKMLEAEHDEAEKKKSKGKTKKKSKTKSKSKSKSKEKTVKI